LSRRPQLKAPAIGHVIRHFPGRNVGTAGRRQLLLAF
jgi:hypothetical protein